MKVEKKDIKSWASDFDEPFEDESLLLRDNQHLNKDEDEKESVEYRLKEDSGSSFTSPENTPGHSSSSPGIGDRNNALTSPALDFDEPFEDERPLLGNNQYYGEEVDGHDLLGDNMSVDYPHLSSLDSYELEQMGDDGYSELSQRDLLEAESNMRKKDKSAGIIKDEKDLLYNEREHNND